MKDASPHSPEARRKRLASTHAKFGKDAADRLHTASGPFEVVKRVAVGVYNDGFIHAGNLAYLAMVALFPFIILAAATAHLVGRSEDGRMTVATILSRLPPDVSSVLAGPIAEVLQARAGTLLWFGAIIGLWTAASFVETIRDILRRAYGVKYCAPFWEYRLGSLAFIVAAVVLLMAAFGATVLLTSVHHAVVAWLPFSDGLASRLGLYRIVPALTLFATIYALFFVLTPSRYRKRECRKWPGALLITAWWLITVELLPDAIGMFGGYDKTYGSLAGVMVALLFFFVIGLGVVMGAELNAALADSGDKALRGEIYSGPFKDELEVEEPQPGEDVVPELVEAEGAQL
ncbi:YihY/virulence factor BrkB family protein [Sphingomonas sp.]|uniref:YihY/virulence factor BrkB family protein n=1 Tax=Sphingomonas sp. TaxID=28214 RepID=UPI00286E5211|nr:YihY/virulence factor BrkB family protein [Sphingomonas sp.]